MKQLMVRQAVCRHRPFVSRKSAYFPYVTYVGRTYSQVKHIRRELNAARRLDITTDSKFPFQSSMFFIQRCYCTEGGSNEEKKEKKNSDKGMESDKDISGLLGGLFGVVSVFYIYWKFLRPEEHTCISFGQFEEEYLRTGKVKKVEVYMSEDRQGEICVVSLYPDDQVSKKTQNRIIVHTWKRGQFQDQLNEFESSHNVPVTERIPVVQFNRVWYTNLRTICDTVTITILLLDLVLILRVWKNRKFFSNKEIQAAMKKHNEMKQQKSMREDLKEELKGPLLSDSFEVMRGDKMENKVTFKDVVGMHEPKTEVLEFMEYLNDPKKFEELGARPPKGALLLGPPGCGKTLLAKALAGECNVPFYTMAGSEFVKSVGGMGASLVRSLFQKARDSAPCIIYIDEIDAIGGKRYKGVTAGSGNSELEHTLNQLLTELDGMQSRQDVMVLASTNRADMLDKALLRPGRLDRHIMIDLPTLKEREELFELYLGKLKLKSPVSTYSKKLAQLTPGMSGADIANICNEAAMHAAREMKSAVTAKDFDYAIERKIAGDPKASSNMSLKEKKVVAYHESGHALVGWLLEHTDALLKVTIVQRTSKVAGFAQYLPKETTLYSNEQIFDMMCMALGGRVAESVIFNEISTGAHDDLNRVTKFAYAQIKTYGMSKNVGLISFPLDDAQGVRPYSQKLQDLMDLEARQLIGQAYKHTEKVITENIDKLHKVAKLLLERETIHATDMENLIGPPPFGRKTLIDTNTLYDLESSDLSPDSDQPTQTENTNQENSV